MYEHLVEPLKRAGTPLITEIDNKLEEDINYVVDPTDALNYNVLQRQVNLIVDMNYDRHRLVQARIEA